MSGTEADPRVLIISPATLAAIVGLTRRRLEQFAAEGMPRSDRGAYPMAQCVQWIIARSGRAVLSPLTSVRRRKIEADAEVAELDLARKRGQFVDAAMIYQVHRGECARLKTRMLAIPSKLAPRVARFKTAAQLAEAIREAIVEALEELSAEPAARRKPTARRQSARPRRAKGHPAPKPKAAKKAQPE